MHNCRRTYCVSWSVPEEDIDHRETHGFGQWLHSFLVLSNCLGNSLKKASGSIFVYIAPTRSVQNEAKLESAGCICLGSNNTRWLFWKAFYLVMITIHLENIHPRMLEWLFWHSHRRPLGRHVVSCPALSHHRIGSLIEAWKRLCIRIGRIEVPVAWDPPRVGRS